VAWILNDMRLVRLDTQGAVAPGWPVGGWRPNPHVIDNGFPQLAMTEDGEGGALVGFNSPGGAAVIRFAGSDTTVAPGWPATGLVLTQTGSWYLQSHMELIRADDTHFVAVWQDWQNGRITAQRFSLSGSLDPNWPANGAAISDSLWDVSLSLHAVPDGAGGVTVVWSGNGGQTIRHVLADGSFPGAYAGGPLAVTGRALVRGRDDGVCILGADLAVSGGVWARWLDGQGHAPDCPSGDCPVTLVPAHDGYLPNAIAGMPDGAGGVYFAYEAYGDSSGPQGHIYRYFISHADYLGIPVNAVPGLPTREALSLSLSPNPSAGPFTARFTLPDAEPARLEVLDLAGRRVASRDVAGAGFHMEAFLEVDRLKSGVYLVRLSSRSARAFARVALVR
jgi:hypothetical protein